MLVVWLAQMLPIEQARWIHNFDMVVAWVTEFLAHPIYGVRGSTNFLFSYTALHLTLELVMKNTYTLD